MGIRQSFRCHLSTREKHHVSVPLWHELSLLLYIREYCRQVESLCLGESLAAIPWFPFNAPWYSKCWTATRNACRAQNTWNAARPARRPSGNATFRTTPKCDMANNDREYRNGLITIARTDTPRQTSAAGSSTSVTRSQNSLGSV